MMLSDAPRYIDQKKEKENQSAEDEAAGIVGFYQSQLSNP